MEYNIKTLGIIQARMGSSRLPGKMLMPIIDGKGALELMLERVAESKKLDSLIVATTIDKSDDQIEELCGVLGVDCYRGSIDDVLDRFYQTWHSTGKMFEAIVRLTGDCPFHNPRVIDLVIEEYLAMDADYVSNVHPPTFPDGLDVEVFSFKILKQAWREAKLQYEREHVTQYMCNHPELFKIRNVFCSTDLSAHRWTLDEESDLKFIRNVYECLYHKGNLCFGMRNILALIEKHPDIKDGNHGIERNEGLKISMKAEENI